MFGAVPLPIQCIIPFTISGPTTYQIIPTLVFKEVTQLICSNRPFSNRPKALWVSHLNPTQTHTLLWVFCVYFSSQPWSALQLTDYSSLWRPTWEHFLFSSIIFTFKQTQMKESLLKRAAFNVSPYTPLTLNYNKIKQIFQGSHLRLN